MTMHILISTAIFSLAMLMTINAAVEIISIFAKIHFTLMADPKRPWKYTFGRVSLWLTLVWTAFYWHFITFVR